jgi:protein TonB
VYGLATGALFVSRRRDAVGVQHGMVRAGLGAILALVGLTSIGVGAQTPRIRVGGDIRPPAKLVHVAPVYPDQARAERIEGTVIVEALIGTDGRVIDVHVLRSVHPLLDASAVEAVSQWEYTPTLLNGEPVELIMSITVPFALAEDEPAGPPPPPPPPPPTA